VRLKKISHNLHTVTITITEFLDFLQHLALSKGHVSGARTVFVLNWKGSSAYATAWRRKRYAAPRWLSPGMLHPVVW
jgi:hypothetical protein